MITPDNKIIIVDDKKEDIDTLAMPFWQEGLSCKGYVYDSSFKPPLKNVRIAFFDININPSGGGSESKQLNDVAMAINQYIAVDNGPFALIFWTSKKEMVDKLKNYIAERYPECPKPFLVDFIDKLDFLDSDKAGGLLERIQTILKDDTLKIIYEFEQNSTLSASKTINQICEIIPHGDTWGDNQEFKMNFEKLLSKIALKSLGFKYAKENPGRGVVMSLAPVFDYHIEKSQDYESWKNYLTTLSQSTKQGDVTYPAGFVEGKLNSIFHIEESNGEKNIRGAVIEIDKNNIDLLTTLNIDNIDNWFDKILPFKDNKKEVRRDIFEKSTLIAIEISAACDFSNQKERINKYIMGFKTPVIKVDADINVKTRIESSYHVGGISFNFNNVDFQLWLNLNYVFGARPDDIRLGKPHFILKKEIMDMIGHKYASHVSRIGITAF